MAEGFIVRKGGVVSETTAAPTITIISETDSDVTFTLKNNDDNTALITYEIDDVLETIELAADATSSNITIALDVGTYTLTAYATVVGEVATKSDEVVEIVIIIEYELLGEVNVTTATTQIDFTGLNITKADEVRLVYTFVGDSTTTTFCRVFPNELTTNTNYHSQFLFGDGTSILSVRSNESRISQARSNQKTSGFADIKVSNNDRFVAQSQFVWKIGSESSQVENINVNIIGTQTVSSITKLSIVSSRTNGIAVGSRLQLYKVVT